MKHTRATVPVIASPALPSRGAVRHAFFTREGGVSAGLYDSLNCGFGSGDEPARVAENRRRAAGALAVGDDALVTAYQVHGTEVATVERPWSRGEAPKADGMVTRMPGIALGILTADCAPVLLADEAAGVIGACHAGWRGALHGIVEATIAAMEALGAARGRVQAAIGPCIAQPSYQVGPEFRAAFVADAPANEGFFAADDDGRYRFDLAGYVGGRLTGAGVAHAASIGLDTCAEAARLFSYRRATLAGEPDFGRGLSAIVLAGDG